jgi:hypothetical protein
MFNWLTSWWGPDCATGVARNAPNGGINIKLFFEQKPTQVIIVTSEEIVTIKNGLRKTEINAIPPISNKNPIMKEFDDVFSQGYQQFFQKRKQQRANIEIIISNPEEEISSEAPVVETTVIESTTEVTPGISTSDVTSTTGTVPVVEVTSESPIETNSESQI